MTMHVVRLGEVCEINPRMPKSLPDDRPVSFLPMAAVSEDGQIDFEERRELYKVKKGYTYFERGDVLVAKITPCFENGKATRTRTLSEPIGFGSTEFHVLRAGEEVDASYLFHLIWNSKFREIGASNMTGSAGQKRVPADFLKRLEIPLPPLDKQRRIATILDKADALHRKRKRALEMFDGLSRSMFLEMFGDPVLNPKSWPRKRIDEICEVITGNTPSRKVAGYYGVEIEWIKSDNIIPGEPYVTNAVEYLSYKGGSVARIAPAGSTLVTCIAGSPNSIGNASMTNRSVAFNQQINALIPLAIDPVFLNHQIRVAKPLIQAASTGGMKGLVSKSRIEKVLLMCPPGELQDEFSTQIAKFDIVRGQLKSSAAKTAALFSSLQHRAFTGQL